MTQDANRFPERCHGLSLRLSPDRRWMALLTNHGVTTAQTPIRGRLKDWRVVLKDLGSSDGIVRFMPTFQRLFGDVWSVVDSDAEPEAEDAKHQGELDDRSQHWLAVLLPDGWTWVEARR